MNAGDNVDDQENYGFKESYFKIDPTKIDDYSITTNLNMQQEKLGHQRNIENNDKRTDERY